MGRFDNDWDRDRHERGERDRYDRDERERDERRPPRQAYTGWAGRGFNQGSFGQFGGQGSNLFARYDRQGPGARQGYPVNRLDIGGGMSGYTGDDKERGYDESRSDRWGSEGGYGQGSEGWSRGGDRGESRGSWAGRDRGQEDDRDWRDARYEGRDRDREEWGRDWGGQGFSGREGGWGGYGSYDRERTGQDRDRGWDRQPERQGSGFWSGGESRESGWGGSRQSSGSQDLSKRGQFAGRGPKGWKRSDDRIREDINERLTDHPDIDASEIEVQVHNGEVTLRGEVGDRDTKRLAEDIAERISGVRDIHNQVRVNRGFWGSIKDAFTGDNPDDEAYRRDRSGQAETTTGDRVSTTGGTPTRAITPSPEMSSNPVSTTSPGSTANTGTATKEPAGPRK